MSSISQHLSKDFKEFIKQLGDSKSKQEEDQIIEQESVALKARFAEKTLTPRQIKELLIRAIYVEMLGGVAPYAHIHAVNLTQNKNLVLKRLGYLGCSLFLRRDSELIIMLVTTILKDLASPEVHDIVVCLSALPSFLNPLIASSIAESVLKLLSHSTDLVRKKAIVAVRNLRKLVDIAEYKEKMKKALCDREPSVMAAVLGLYIEEAQEQPRKWRDMTNSFVAILKQVIEHKLPKEYSYHRVPAPWIQIRLLQVLEILGKGDQRASEHMYVILEQTLKRAEETGNNIGLAVTYQAIRTIALIYPNEALRKEAASILPKFLDVRSLPSIKCMGVQALGLLLKDSPDLLDSYQLVLVDCLESKDDTLRGITLDLLAKLANYDNVQLVVSKMLNCLHSTTDPHNRNHLVNLITTTVERLSSSRTWYISTMLMLFELGSEYLSDVVLNNFLRIVLEGSDEMAAADMLPQIVATADNLAPTDFTLSLSAYATGELADSADEASIRRLFQMLETENCKRYAIDALAKLASRPGFPHHAQLKLMLDKYGRHTDLELASRALGKAV